jgi:beta-aspartyl-peptidase (threonine type)
MTPRSELIQYALVIHGGAGRIVPSTQWRSQREEVLRSALDSGQQMLAQGGTSLDVVENVVRMLEDAPCFNAGRGASLTAYEDHELDASIMDGRNRACGAVGGVRTVRNPISLARLVMSHSRHVMLVADGAERFADEVGAQHGIQRVPNSYFTTEDQRERLLAARAKHSDSDIPTESKGAKQPPPRKFGTVGCTALDIHGNLAAGTSTGGMVNKEFGRIGDSPIIGAGTYADNATCAVSCTGWGEDFIRHAAAYDVVARMQYLGQSLHDAVQATLEGSRPPLEGGIIAVSRQGEITMPFNTEGMSRAAADSQGRYEVHVADN